MCNAPIGFCDIGIVIALLKLVEKSDQIRIYISEGQLNV